MTALSDALLAYSPWALWKLDDASGLPQDSSGNGRHMTTAAAGLTYAQAQSAFPGAGSLCLVGDGSANGYCNISATPGDLADGTIFGLAQIRVLGDIGCVCTIGQMYHFNNSWGIGYGWATADKYGICTNGGTNDALANAASLDDTWYSVCAVLSGSSSFIFYVNGVAQTDTTTFDPGVPTPTTVWVMGEFNNALFNGNMALSHVSIIESALTAPQIVALHNTALGLTAAGGPPNMSPPQFGGWGAC